MKKVLLAGTFDTKGHELAFIKELFEDLGVGVITVNLGVFAPVVSPDIDVGEVVAYGGYDISEIRERNDRAYATKVISEVFADEILDLQEQYKFDGIFSIGGSGGTALVTKAMQNLPIGFPKMVVSTMASGNTNPYVGNNDIVLYPSIVDVAGLNNISKQIFSNAVRAMVGMVNLEVNYEVNDKPLIGASMFGNTTKAVDTARERLEEAGYEVLVFHATGSGGQIMESLVESGYLAGVLDLTTTELVDELVGGILSAGPDRLEAAAVNGLPQVVAPGAIDEANFGPRSSVPEKYQDRNLYEHNPTITLMRTSVEECKKLGEITATQLNKAIEHVVYLWPKKGTSAIDIEGGPFWHPEANAAFLEALKANLNNDNVELVELDNHINDKEFGEYAAKRLIEQIESK